jgi:hypothetical protein
MDESTDNDTWQQPSECDSSDIILAAMSITLLSSAAIIEEEEEQKRRETYKKKEGIVHVARKTEEECEIGSEKDKNLAMMKLYSENWRKKIFQVLGITSAWNQRLFMKF